MVCPHAVPKPVKTRRWLQFWKAKGSNSVEPKPTWALVESPIDRMTNTLHRYGTAESFEDDYVLFAIPCKGKNDDGAVEKLKAFLSICAKHGPGVRQRLAIGAPAQRSALLLKRRSRWRAGVGGGGRWVFPALKSAEVETRA